MIEWISFLSGHLLCFITLSSEDFIVSAASKLRAASRSQLRAASRSQLYVQQRVPSSVQQRVPKLYVYQRVPKLYVQQRVPSSVQQRVPIRVVLSKSATSSHPPPPIVSVMTSETPQGLFLWPILRSSLSLLLTFYCYWPVIVSLLVSPFAKAMFQRVDFLRRIWLNPPIGSLLWGKRWQRYR